MTTLKEKEMDREELRRLLRPFACMADSMFHAKHGETVVLLSGQDKGRFGEWPVAKFRAARRAYDRIFSDGVSEDGK